MRRHFLAIVLSSVLVLQPAAAASSVTIAAQEVSGSFPRGAQRVPVLLLTVTLPCDASGTITQLAIRHGGMGDVADIDGIYVLQGDRRVSNVAHVQGKNETFALRLRPLALTLCAQTQLQVVMNISPHADASGEHSFSLVGASSGNGTNFLLLETQATSAQPTRVVPGTVGSVDFTSLPLLARALYGPSRIVARFQLSAEDRNQDITSLTLTNDGSARDSDLQNLTLTNSRYVELSRTQKTMQGDRVTFVFDPPLRLQKGQTVLLQAKADVRAPRKRTIRFVLDDPSDIASTPVTR